MQLPVVHLFISMLLNSIVVIEGAGAFSKWEAWGPCQRQCDEEGGNGYCDVNCGLGKQRYLRKCQSSTLEVCNGKKSEIKFEDCEVLDGCQGSTPPPTTTRPSPIPVRIPCPKCVCQCSTTECQWGQWSQWNACTQTCGHGKQTKSRRMQGPDYCFGTEHRDRFCEGNLACPQWSEWSGWSVCQPDCRITGIGSQRRRRRCLPEVDTQFTQSNRCPVDFETGAAGSMHLQCPFNDSESKLKVWKDICGISDQQAVESVQMAVSQVVDTTGYAFVCIVCIFLLLMFLFDCNFTTQRAFHMPQELALLFANILLIIMDKVTAQELHCYIVMMCLNGAFLVYFTFLLCEAIHILVFVSHVVRRNGIIPVVLQYLLAILFIGGILALYWVYLKQDLVVSVTDTTPEGTISVRKLCWMRHCDHNQDAVAAAITEQDTADLSINRLQSLNVTLTATTTMVATTSSPNISSSVHSECESMAAPRTWFLIHAALVSLTLVATESAMVQRRHYPYPLPATNWRQYNDAKLAMSGMYLKTILGTLSMVATFQANWYQLTSPNESTVVFFWGAAALCCSIAFGCCVAFFHSLGNAKVRDKLQAAVKQYCGCCRKRKRKKKRRHRKQQLSNIDKIGDLNRSYQDLSS